MEDIKLKLSLKRENVRDLLKTIARPDATDEQIDLIGNFILKTLEELVPAVAKALEEDKIKQEIAKKLGLDVLATLDRLMYFYENKFYLELSQLATAKTAREIALEERIAELEALLTSARAIAQRKGEGTAWNRFDKSIQKLGNIGSITARTYRLLEGETEA